MSFAFYATRTSGQSPSFDQILEFAAIRTDAEFVEAERFEASSRLLPHIVASPATLLASQSAISTLSASSRPSHYAMACRVHERLCNWSPSTFAGFNSLFSDELFLRQCLYQTLHPPYLTSCNGNTRADVAKVIQASLLLAPDALAIPQGADGVYDIDLCAVASANGLQCGRNCTASEAAVAIAGLARLLSERAPDLWSTAMRFSKKAAVVDFIENEPIFSLSGFYYGKPRCWLVALIGINTDNPVECYLFNLQVDPGELRELPDDALHTRVTETPKPVRLLKTNSVPILTLEDEAPASAAGKEFDRDELSRRVNILRSDQFLRERLIRAFAISQPQKSTSAHVEEQLYDNFISDDDTRLMEKFHATPWERRPSIVSRFADIRLKRIGQRLIHFERPDVLDPARRKQFDQTIAQRLLGLQSESPWMTLPKAIGELDRLIAAAPVDEHPHLHDHRTQLAAEVERFESQLSI